MPRVRGHAINPPASPARPVCWRGACAPALQKKAPPRQKRVPVHIDFMFHRMLELVMLTLGETVLGLVLALAQADVDIILREEGVPDPGPGGEYLAHFAERAHEAHAHELAASPPPPPLPGAVNHHTSRAHRAHRLLGGSSDETDLGVHALCSESRCSFLDHFTQLGVPVDMEAECEPCSVAPRRDLAFVSAFILISTLVYMYHHVNPQRRHHHATRRSLGRGIVWSYSHWFLVLGIIGLAASIKECFVLSAAPVPHGISTLLGDTLGICLMVIMLQQVLHPGHIAYVFAPYGRMRRLAFFSLRFVLAASLFCAHAAPFEIPGYLVLIAAGSVTLLSAVLLAGEKSEAEAYRRMWSFADDLLTQKMSEKEAMAMGPGDGRKGAESTTKTPKGIGVFTKPESGGTAGCLPCLPGGKRNGYGSSLNEHQWERLG